MPLTRGPQNLAKEIEICDAGGGSAHRFPLVEDRFGRLLWDQGSVPAEDAEPGTELTKTWDYFGGGMGESHDLQELLGVKTGGYYFSDDIQVSNPYALRPRQEVTTVTLTNNVTEVTHMFEAKSASGTKKLYAITGTKAHRLDISGASTLHKNTKDFSTPDVEFATGAYTGTAATQTIDVGFAVKFLILKRGDSVPAAFFKTDGMGTYEVKSTTGPHWGDATDGLAFSGSTLVVYGSNAYINASGGTYYWMAFGGDYVVTGSFAGDGNDDRDIDENEVAGFAGWGQPDAVFIFTNNDSDHVCFRNKTDTADSTVDLASSGATVANIIEASADWPTHGFEVGSDNRANRATGDGDNVFFAAMKTSTNVLEISSHTGDGVDPQAVTGLGYEPTWVLLYTDSGTAGVKPIHRSDRCSGDSSMYFDGTVNAADLVESLDSDGYSVGGADDVNENTKTFYCLSLRTDPAGAVICGQPAEWNEIWELPKGPNVNRAGLTAIVDGTGDDTWTTRSTGSPKADHLCVVENELVRASADRMIDKCSALNTDVDANWTGDYNVGQPGTKITSLVNVSGEVGVGTTDGFYLFDMIAQSRQQLPLLAGISDDDNAKGTTVVATMVLVPTVDGAWRILSGAGAQFGPDSNEFYSEVEGPSSIPIKLKHYGFAYLGTYVYNAVYDGTSYHIIYSRLNPRNPTLVGAKWDFLLTHTNKITVLKVDSERRLWFNYANNIAYIQLSRGGAPDGGNWGEALVASLVYTPITSLGTPALKRLRMIEFETRNTDGVTGFYWRAYVLRDGAALAQVSTNITTDGVSERFWTAGTSDTCRRIQIAPYCYCAGAYTPSSTPPELFRITLHAEPLMEDADVIVCSIDLSENAKEKIEIIESKLNSAPIKLIDALTGKKHTVVLYRRRVYQVRQAGTDPPKAACELRFRRSDIA